MGEQGQPVHLGHVEVGQHDLDVWVLFEEREGLLAVAGEHEAELAPADLVAKALANQQLDVRLVVDDEQLDRALRRHHGSISLVGSS
ncbi:MAG TPA: hypothetical protein DEA08_13100 [Planctomycetes bacterium]|nr:hypothetical protein [Planctomycetota bacterium]